jgi:rare lipoprotein A
MYKKSANACVKDGALKVGNPYTIDGERYVPLKSSYGYKEKGIASWYGSDFHGKSSANGECYNMYAFTAAHKTLPLPTIVRVTNLENGKSVVLKVNDRGPYARGRIIDLSYAAAQSLGVVAKGTAPVQVEAIGGPHNQPGGYAGGAYDLSQALGPGPRVVETVPSLLPSPVVAEDISVHDDSPFADARKATAAFEARQQQRQAAQGTIAATETAEEKALGLPAPATNLPAPPAADSQPLTDTSPLLHTRVYVQVGAYGDAARANAQKAKLEAQHYTTDVSPLPLGNGTSLLRVRAGPFRSVGEAESALDTLVQAGFNGAQIRVEGGEVAPGH